MSHQWRVKVDDKLSKPLSSEEVNRFYKAGKIPPNALLSRDGQTWRTMKEVIEQSAARRLPSANAPQIDSTRADQLVHVSLHCRCGWQKRVAVSTGHLGKQTRCPKCREIIQISNNVSQDEQELTPSENGSVAPAHSIDTDARRVAVSRLLRQADLSMLLRKHAWVSFIMGLVNAALIGYSYNRSLPNLHGQWTTLLTCCAVVMALAGLSNLILVRRNSFMVEACIFFGLAIANASDSVISVFVYSPSLWVVLLVVNFLLISLQYVLGMAMLRAHREFSSGFDEFPTWYEGEDNPITHAIRLVKRARSLSDIPHGKLQGTFVQEGRPLKQTYPDCNFLFLDDELLIVSKQNNIFNLSTHALWLLHRGDSLSPSETEPGEDGRVILFCNEETKLHIKQTTDLAQRFIAWTKWESVPAPPTDVVVAYREICDLTPVVKKNKQPESQNREIPSKQASKELGPCSSDERLQPLIKIAKTSTSRDELEQLVRSLPDDSLTDGQLRVLTTVLARPDYFLRPDPRWDAFVNIRSAKRLEQCIPIVLNAMEREIDNILARREASDGLLDQLSDAMEFAAGTYYQPTTEHREAFSRMIKKVQELKDTIHFRTNVFPGFVERLYVRLTRARKFVEQHQQSNVSRNDSSDTSHRDSMIATDTVPGTIKGPSPLLKSVLYGLGAILLIGAFAWGMPHVAAYRKIDADFEDLKQQTKNVINEARRSGAIAVYTNWEYKKGEYELKKKQGWRELLVNLNGLPLRLAILGTALLIAPLTIISIRDRNSNRHLISLIYGIVAVALFGIPLLAVMSSPRVLEALNSFGTAVLFYPGLILCILASIGCGYFGFRVARQSGDGGDAIQSLSGLVCGGLTLVLFLVVVTNSISKASPNTHNLAEREQTPGHSSNSEARQQSEPELGPKEKALERMGIHSSEPDSRWLSCSAETTDDDLKYLAEFSRVTNLTIDRAHITDDGLRHLGHLTTLEDLDLSGTSISDAGLAHLAELTRLEELDLSNTRIQGAGLRHLRNIRTLKQLNLRDVQITDAGLDELRQALPKLVVYPEELRSPLVQRQAMFKLQQLGGRVNASSDRIAFVSLSDSGITNEDLQTVAKFPNLYSLDISGTRITDEGLSHLRNLRELHSLNLSHTRLEGSGFKHLEGLMKLEELMVEDANLADGGAGLDQLRAALPELKVEPNEWCLPSEERRARQALTAMGIRVRMESNYVNNKRQYHVAGVDLSRRLVRSRSAGRRGRRGEEPVAPEKAATPTDDLFQHLHAFKRLESLNLYGSDITDEGLSELASLSSLQEVNLARTRVTDKGLQALAELPLLRDLSLNETQITDDGLASLEGLMNLEQLNLDETKVTDKCIPLLLCIPNLRYLSASGSHMTEEGIKFWRHESRK